MKLCGGGCGSKIADDAKRCAECQAERNKQQSTDDIKQHRDADLYDAQIDALNKGARWQRLREKALKKQPFCARCNTGWSVIADHIVPAWEAIRQARESKYSPFDPWAGYYIPSNIQGLCRPCHGLKTIEDKQHVGAWPDVIAKQQAQPKKVWTF